VKVIVTTLNSKFIHSNLAIRYLKAFTEDLCNIEIEEYTINQHIDFIVSDLYKKKADIICFSTYIWNLNETLEICETLKIVNPNLKILLGGPEVSFDPEVVLENNNFIDYIIFGEGELTFKEFIEHKVMGSNNYEAIKGLAYRDGDKIIKNENRELIKDLNIIPSPYDNIGKDFENKIIYYESSRGCPFNCAFCLSSTIKGVRYFDIERVKKDLGSLIDGKVRQVKFVDRTFNANKKYAKEIMNYIMEKDPVDINFHFEVTAHLLDDDMLEFISKAKEGLFQFEIGVQSTNDKTIDAIGRTTDFEKLSEVTRKIKSFNNIHQHLDLIAGLPYEGYDSFKNSFNDVYNLKPEKLQLGFLKLLKGSKLRAEEDKYGFKYLDKPPYEILENDFISYEDILKLHNIEDLVEKYFNEDYFSNSLDYIIKNHYEDPFSFYEELLEYWESREYHKVSHSRDRLYDILKEFVYSHHYDDYEEFENLIKYDYIYNHTKKRLPGMLRLKEEKNNFNIHDVLKNDEILNKYLSKYKDLPTRKVLNLVTVEYFSINPLSIISGNQIKQDSYILFKHKEGELDRCSVFDISYIIKELI